MTPNLEQWMIWVPCFCYVGTVRECPLIRIRIYINKSSLYFHPLSVHLLCLNNQSIINLLMSQPSRSDSDSVYYQINCNYIPNYPARILYTHLIIKTINWSVVTRMNPIVFSETNQYFPKIPKTYLANPQWHCLDHRSFHCFW